MTLLPRWDSGRKTQIWPGNGIARSTVRVEPKTRDGRPWASASNLGVCPHRGRTQSDVSGRWRDVRFRTNRSRSSQALQSRI